jgi:hypothetical protein
MEEKLSKVLKFKPSIFIHVVGLDDNAVKQETVYKLHTNHLLTALKQNKTM